MHDIYAAGLFDGEGYIRINRWEKPNSWHIRYQVLCGIGMTYLPVIEDFAATYSGGVHMNRHDLKNPNHRIQFFCVVGSQIACAFLRRVLPHLIVKRDQAVLALELQADIDKHRFKLGNRSGIIHPDHAKIRAYRERLAAEISDHKKIAFPAYSTLAPDHAAADSTTELSLAD